MILDFDYITMGQRIKQRRKELNMTQAEKSLLLEKASENEKARLMTIITKEENV